MNLKEFQEILLTRKAEIEKILYSISQDISEISSCDIKEDGDFAVASMDTSREFNVYMKLKEELKEIEDALEKIKRGDYGICEMCDDYINEERLKIKPFAKYCIKCRTIIEKEQR
ncbi:MAG: RNA polymerase-binding protein DksA [Nautiliaceae bacterium]